jgi:hypothetical protein
MSFGTKKTILTVLVTVSLLSWLLHIYFYYFHFQALAPITPNAATGQIYRVNNKGYVFYLTMEQEITAYIPFGVAVVAFVIGALLENRWKVYEKIHGKPLGDYFRGKRQK